MDRSRWQVKCTNNYLPPAPSVRIITMYGARPRRTKHTKGYTEMQNKQTVTLALTREELEYLLQCITSKHPGYVNTNVVHELVQALQIAQQSAPMDERPTDEEGVNLSSPPPSEWNANWPPFQF